MQTPSHSQVLALVASQVVLVQLVGALLLNKEPAPLDLNSLCSGKEVELRESGDLAKLFDELDKNEDQCPSRVREAVYDLMVVVSDQKPCLSEHVDNLLEFVDDYLTESNDNGQQLPAPLVNFAVSYGMKAAYYCKREMVHEFASSSQLVLVKRLGHSAFKQLERYLVDQSPLSTVLQPITEHGDTVLPSDLFAVVPGLESEVLSLFAHFEGLDQLGKLCANILQPLYEPLLLPLARLQRAGFGAKDVDCPSRRRRMVTFWTTASFLCETIKLAKTANKSNPNDDRSKVREQLEQMVHESASRQANEHNLIACIPPESDMDEPLEPYDCTVLFYDPIVSPNSRDTQSSLVKSYDANKSELERLREKIQANSLRVFKMMAAKGDSKQFAKKIAKILLFQKHSERDLKEAEKGLVSLLDAPEEGSKLFSALQKMADFGIDALLLTALVVFFPVAAVLLPALAIAACFLGSH